MASNDIECNQRGGAQQIPPAGAGTARVAGRGAGSAAASAAGPVAGIGEGAAAGARQWAPGSHLRWVGSQHLMHGYCGRAGQQPPRTTVLEVTVVAAAAATGIATGGVRANVPRPAALLEARRHLVVRIGPRAAGGTSGGPATPASGEGDEDGQARARAA